MGARPARNDPCACGSGKKYKHCCGLADLHGPPSGAGAAPRAPNPQQIGALIAMVNGQHLQEAERRTRELLSRYPNAGMLWKVLGVALLRQAKDPVPALRRAVELMPQDAQAHGNLGAALHDRGRWAEALSSLRRALELEPHDVQALVDAANSMRALGRAGDSLALYGRALELDPRQAEAQNNLGNAYLELGRPEDAARCYRRALDISPRDALIHCNLGNALRHFGSLAEATAATRRALELDSSLSIAHNNLGLCLAASGKRNEAVASYRRALMLNADYVDALNNLGNVLRDLGDRRQALSLYARAVELDPKRPESHYHLGSALFELRRIEESAKALRRALVLDPRYALAHLSLGAALRMMGRPSDAEASCRTALAIEPRCVEALSLLGELHADRGRFSEAEALFQQAIAIDPCVPFAFHGIAMHRKMTSADTAWRAGVEALLARRLPLAQEISLHYALGKYCDDIEQYEEAFGHYRRANELTKRYGTPYDPAKFKRRVDEVISSFGAASLRQPRVGASGSELPVFIMGMPRSGTSLAEQILASHPAVFGAGELNFWDAAFAIYQKHRREGRSEDSIEGIARDYLARLADAAPGRLRVIDKMPANFLYAGLIHTVFPRARIIHMQRHPIDCCLSIYFQNFFNMGPYANDLDNLAAYYREYLRITEHWRTVLPAQVLLEVPYEGLTEDQRGWTHRMLEFIGLPWDSRCLDFHRTERVVLTASKWQVRQKMHTGSAGRFRNYERFLGPLAGLASNTSSGPVASRAKEGAPRATVPRDGGA